MPNCDAYDYMTDNSAKMAASLLVRSSHTLFISNIEPHRSCVYSLRRVDLNVSFSLLIDVQRIDLIHLFTESCYDCSTICNRAMQVLCNEFSCHA